MRMQKRILAKWQCGCTEERMEEDGDFWEENVKGLYRVFRVLNC